MPAVATDESLIGRLLVEKYRIIRVIGRGGMGVVYEAEHTVLGKRVAIKLMLDKYFEDSEAKARFRREAIAASRIGNPHIIDVSDIGTAPDGREYVVMELLEGKPLSEVIEQGGPMPPWRAIAIMRQVLRAIGVAHSKGIIHRDLKPDNIFLIGHDAQNDFVKLLDFGISKVLDPDEQIALTKLTTTGVVMGTPLYMAPEQAMGQTASAAADIYACGVILYEMLSGRTPFIGNTYAVLVAQLLTAPPEPLQNLRPGLPLALVNAVHRALEKEPERRFASADMFAASLPGERTHSQIELAGTLDSGIAVARVAPSKPRRRGTMLAIGGALLLGAATAGVLIATQAGQSKDPAKDSQQQQEAKPEPPPAPKPEVKPIQPETPPQTGLLKLSSEPEGATAYVDGSHIGPTPCEVNLKPGKHTVRYELAGFEVSETTTEVDVGSNRFSTRLVKAKKGSTTVVGSRPSTPQTPQTTNPATPKTAGRQPPSSDLPPSLPVVGPQKAEPVEQPQPKKPPPPVTEQPKGGKENPYTKPNPYKQ